MPDITLCEPEYPCKQKWSCMRYLAKDNNCSQPYHDFSDTIGIYEVDGNYDNCVYYIRYKNKSEDN